MPFVTIPGVVGKVYVPDEQPEHEKKHKCKDCFSCQHCSDDRCELCTGEKLGTSGRGGTKSEYGNGGLRFADPTGCFNSQNTINQDRENYE